jgi:hypothetical protein
MSNPTGRGLPDWTQGTATATIGQRDVTFSGAGLITTDGATGAQIHAAGRGDLFVVDGVDAVPIANVIDASTIRLVRPWTGPTQTNAAYAIIRMSIPATGSVAKAIKDLLDQGSDAKPDVTRTCDDSTARIKIDPHSGAPAIRVGASGAADAALKDGIRFDKDAGAASFPSGLLLPVTGFRNRIRNGLFQVWQRGTSFSIAAGVQTPVADGWLAYVSNVGSGTTVSRITAPAGFRAAQAMSLQGSSIPAGSGISFRQRFEGEWFKDMAGDAAVLSFDVAASTSAGTLTGWIVVNTNTGVDNGTYSTAVVTGRTFTIPGGGGRVSVNLTGAETASFALGGSISIQFQQWTATGNVSISLGSVQLEKGTIANPLEFRPLTIERLLCQRYLQRLIGWSGVWLTSTDLPMSGQFAVPMRTTPTLQIIDGASAIVQPGVTARSITGVSSTVLDPDGGDVSFITDGGSMGAFGILRRNSKIFATAEL